MTALRQLAHQLYKNFIFFLHPNARTSGPKCHRRDCLTHSCLILGENKILVVIDTNKWNGLMFVYAKRWNSLYLFLCVETF